MEIQDKPLLINNINFNSINISKINIENNTRKNLYLKYNDNNFIIQTPELFYNNKIKEMKDYYEIIINIVCRNEEKTNKFITFLNNLDKYFITLVSKRRTEFFNNNNIKYKSILREKNNNKFIKLKLLKYNIHNNLLKLVSNNTPITLQDLNDKCYLKILININAIWINNNIFGIYLKPIIINKKIIIDYNIDFIEDSDNQKTILDSTIDTNINSIESSILKQNNNTEKVLISNNHTSSTKLNNKNKDKVLISNNHTSSTKLNNTNKDKVLISNNHTSSTKLNNTNTSSITISSISNKDNKVNNDSDMSTINFTTLENIPEYNNNNKNKDNSSTS